MPEQLSIERIFSDPALEGPTPRDVKVSPDGQRVALLRGRADDQHQLDLWIYDINTASLEMRVDSKRLAPAEQLSRAELARRERERIADYHGIVHYDWAPDGHHVLFTLDGNLYLYDLDPATSQSVRQLTHGTQSVLDAKVSPRGRYVSFVRDQNLIVIDLNSGQERQLSSDGGGTVHNAEAEFVAQEEMGQTSGYWWSPDDSAIAYKQFDERDVPIARRFEIYADRTEVVEQRYPAAGDSNVSVRLGLVAPTGGETRWIDLGGNPDIYLVRADWTPDARTLVFQRLSRDQRRLDLIGVAADSLRQTPFLTETSNTWVNLSNDLHFLKHPSALVWSSERSGNRHLYLIGMDGRVLHPLTAGDWQVDELLSVDEKTGLAYFAANRDAIIDRQIYTVHLDGRDAGRPHRISKLDGTHEAQFARDAQQVSLYVDSFSNDTTATQVSINAPDGHRLAWIEANELKPGHPYWPFHTGHVVPEFGQIPAEDGQLLQYSLMKPPGFDPAHRYPVFISVYGGPTVQNVQRRWPAGRDFFNEYMARRGYIVFTLDNRGSGRRGRRFQDVIHGRLGEAEVHDQLTGARWLQQQPWVNPRKIGVFGWSYGGFMTLMLLAKGSDVIAAGAAVAPVTDWRLYDTCYTERYLDRPQDNPHGYELSAVFSALDGLRSPLFLAHGMADDNVLFTNSTRLMSELQQRGVQFGLMTYPGAKHGLSTPQMKTHVFTAIADFFDAHLKSDDASRTATVAATPLPH
ncbi:MAG TPA: S9 family peptidase [Steroidobacteraceae bacterium]|nr:S9 family peptidase [Steroidobacteraceae bacterium]